MDASGHTSSIIRLRVPRPLGTSAVELLFPAREAIGVVDNLVREGRKGNVIGLASEQRRLIPMRLVRGLGGDDQCRSSQL